MTVLSRQVIARELANKSTKESQMSYLDAR